MSLRNGVILSLALSTLTFLVACGGSSSPPRAQVPPTGGFSDSNLNGTYVFSISGVDFAGDAYSAVGAFVANGSGGIKGGTIDMNDSAFPASLPDVQINSNSVYDIGVDGRGTITIGIPNSPFSSNMTFGVVLQNSSHGLITEFDGNATGSGTFDLQSAGATPAGTYAFSLSGASSSGEAYATVGNFTIGSGGSISGLDDLNEGSLASYADQALSGSFSPGPANPPATTLSTPAFTGLFDVYVVDANHLKFIEMDTGIAYLSGDAYSQTGANNTMPVGTLAFTLSGFAGTDTPFAAGGFMVTDGSGDITSQSGEDYNDGGGTSISSNLGPFSGSYFSGGTGRYTLGNFSTFVGGSSYAAYPSSGGLLLLEIDTSGITAGAAYAQTPGATLAASQGYGLNLSGLNLSSDVEVDDIAEFVTTTTACGTATGSIVDGLIDENYDPEGSPISSQVLCGNYSVSAGTGQIVTVTENNTINGGFVLDYFSVDGTTFPFIEADSTQVSTGVFVKQSANAVSSSASKPAMFVQPPLIRPHGSIRKKQ